MILKKTRFMVARKHTAGIISGFTDIFQKLCFFSIINLTNKVFESIYNRLYPLDEIQQHYPYSKLKKNVQWLH